MKNLIKLNGIHGGQILINPHHIVIVNTYNLKPKARAEVICLVGAYQVKETQEEIENLVNGEPGTNYKPAVGETYYYYDLMNDEKQTAIYANKDPHTARVSIGNCFKTAEEVNFDKTISSFLNKQIIKPGEEAV